MADFSFIDDMQNARKDTSIFHVKLSDIQLINPEQIKVKGTAVPMDHEAFKDLLKITGVTNAMVTHLNSTIQHNAGFNVVQAVMKAIGNQKGVMINLVIDSQNKRVVRISAGGEQSGAPISAVAIQEFLKELTSSEKIELAQTMITNNGTKVSFNVKYDVHIPLKMPGETVSFGKQITWDMFGDLSVVDMIERLICTNGMTGIRPGDNAILLNSETDPSAWYNTLYKDLLNPNKKILDHYESKALEAMQTALSVYEFNKIKAHALGIWRDDVDRIIRHIGDDRDWKVKYEQRGIDLEKATSAQLRNCPTPVNAWDAINLLTDLASHTYNTPVSATTKKVTQKLAGQLLNSNWDENGWMDNLPKFDLKRKV